MKLCHHFFRRRREMEVPLIRFLFLLPMGVVGVAEVEALERGKESTDDLPCEKNDEKKNDLRQSSPFPLE